MDAEKKKGCSLFLDNIDDYIDGELDEGVANEVKSHLDGCAECKRLFDETVAMLKDASELDSETAMPLDCQLKWRTAVRSEAKRVSGRKVVKSIIRAAGAVAAAAVIILGARLAMPRQGKVIPLAAAAVYDEQELSASTGFMGYGARSAVTGDMLLQSDGENDAEALVSQRTGANDVDTSVIIRKASRKIESSVFDQCVKSINDLVEEYQGYFEQSTLEGQPIEQGELTGRVAKMTARIPSVDLDAFLTAIDVVGTVTYSRVTSDDISENYYDAKSRLSSYRNQLNRLNELVTTAADLEQLLMLEEKISQTQYDIDSLEGSISSWDNQVGYSTVTISVTEVSQRDRIAPPAESLGERAKVAFYDSVNWLNELWQNIVIGLAAIVPALVIIIPALAIILGIVAFIKKRKR